MTINNLACSAAVLGLLGGIGAAPAAAQVPEAPLTQTPVGVGATEATLRGVLNPGPSTGRVSFHFSYGTEPESACPGGTSAPLPPAEAEGHHKLVSVRLHGLEASTEYSYCIVAADPAAPSEAASGGIVSFTTLPSKPIVTGSSAEFVTPSGATLTAEVNPENQTSSECTFEYGVTVKYGRTAPCEPGTIEGSEPTLESAAIASLQPTTTYHYRIVIADASGRTRSADAQFTTPPAAPPAVIAASASELGRKSAALSGSLSTAAAPTRYRFLYIDDAGYRAAVAASAPDPYASGGATATQMLEASEAAIEVGPEEVAELLPGTTYHFALEASNAAGAVIGPDETFTTAPPTPAVVETGSPATLGTTSAVLSGSGDGRGLPTSFWFEFGPVPLAGSLQPAAAAPRSDGSVALGLEVAGLAPATTYYYRAVATNEDGTSYGEEASFATPAGVIVPPPAAYPAVPFVPFSALEAPAGGVAGARVMSLPRAVQLGRALRACKRLARPRRSACERRARRRYGAPAVRHPRRSRR